MAVQIQMRRGLSGDWTTADPTLAAGEWGLETNTDKFKIGDGSTAWTNLDYSSLGVGTAGGTFAGTVNFGADGTGQDVNFYSGTAGDHMKWDASEEQLVITGTNAAVALHVADGNALFADDVTITGSLTVNGATTTISTTNTLVEDSLIELNTGASSNANDLGIVMERGSTGNNAIIAWDESADKFTMGTTTATGASTGDLTIATGTLVADLEGDVTGDVTGDVSGSSGSTTGNAATATVLATGRTINGVSFNGSANITVVDSAALPLAGGTLSGAIVAADQIISAPVMKDYSESTQAMVAHDVDLTLGNVQTYTLSGNQTLTFSNAPASGKAGSFTLIVTNGASATLTWPTSVDWAGGTAPTLTASGKDILTFTTIDGGTIWYGFAAGLDMK